jgi:hypothetical protein
MLAASFVAACLLGAKTASAADAPEPVATPTMDLAMKGLAQEITQYLGQRSETDVILGPFTGPEGTSAGPRIVQALTTALDGKMKVVAEDACSVTGEYVGMEDEGTGKFVVQVDAEITDRTNLVVRKLVKYICTSEQEAVAILGTTGDLPLAPETRALEEERAEVINPETAPPTITAVDSIIRPSPDSPFGIELLVQRGEELVPLPVVIEGGQASVDIKPTDLYVVRLINDSPLPFVGVTLTIDGVNMFAFSHNPGYRKLGKVVVAGKSGLIRGWHDSDEQSWAFQVQEFGPNLPAAQFGSGSLGVITATFCAAFPPNQAPADEPPAEFAERGGTGFGPSVAQRYTPMRLEFGAIRSAISIRYSRN